MSKIFKILLFSFFLLTTFVAFSQKGGKKEKVKMNRKQEAHEVAVADKHFDNMEFFLAAQEYEKVVNADPNNKYALYRLAESYRNYFDYLKAEECFKKATISASKEYPNARFWLAIMLKTNGKYEEAEESFKKYIEDHLSESSQEIKDLVEKAKIEFEGCELALNEMKKPRRDYSFENLPSPLNTPESEYSPTMYENDSSIIVTSAREESTGDKDFAGLGGKFTDNYRFNGNNKSWIPKNNDDNFNNVVNTKYNESAGSFNKDKTKFYFTRCDEPFKTPQGTDFQCVIYVTTFKDGKWISPVKLNENINMKGQWDAQPSISPNSDTIFFVSKRPGGHGMHDIWYSTSKGDDNWGTAVNMGDSVNTPFIDMSPNYYSGEKVLFFSSNGHKGFGGLDIFKATGPSFTKVTNVGLPFNSNRDDFYFVLGKEKGLLASNREGGVGHDDIYRFKIEGTDAVIAEIKKDSMEKFKSVTVQGKLLDDETKQPVEDVEVLLKDNENKTLKKTVTDQEGNFKYDNLSSDKDYKLTLNDSNRKLTADVKYISSDLKLKGSQQMATKTLFESIYFDFNKHDLRPESIKVLDELVEYYNEHSEIQIEMNANTDNIGSDEYNKKLSEERGKTALQYLVSKGVRKTALVVNAMGAGKPIATNDNAMGRQLNRRVEFSIIGGPGYQAKAMAYVIEPKMNLYQVAKKFHMTIEELKELNNLEGDNVMAYRPLRVRRTGDEDIIAPVTLTTVKQLPEDHVDHNPHRTKTSHAPITEKETGLSFGNNHSLGEDEEFYVVEPLNTVYSISHQFGMTPEELKNLNGLRSNKLRIGQKIKVKRKK